MNTTKKIAGVLLILLSPCMVLFMAMQAHEKISNALPGVATTNTLLQWGIILVIFIPVCAALAIFGYYAAHGEYNEQ